MRIAWSTAAVSEMPSQYGSTWAAMKSTADASSGCSIQAFQISPVVTGTEVSRLTRWILLMSSSVVCSPRIDRLVADHDAVDVAMLAGEIDDGAHFALVALGVLVDPGADRNAQAELAGDLGHELGAAGRRIGADHPGVGRDGLQVGADLLGARCAGRCRDGLTIERRVGDAGELAIEGGSTDDVPRNSPHAGMNASDENADKNDDAH